MANAEKIKKALAVALCGMEMVTSFASSFDPMFGIVSSLVAVARRGLVEDEGHVLDKDLEAINTKLESISQNNHQCLKKIHIYEVNETYGKYEEKIKHQYTAFSSMVEQAKNDPDNTQDYMKNFKKVYEKDGGDLSLGVYYNGVMGYKLLFGRTLLKVYLDNCEGDREIMQRHCSHIAHLFQMGLSTLMAYTAVTEDDKDGVREMWAQRMEDIECKMQEALSQCKDKSS